MSEIGNKIKQKRKQKGLSQEELAESAKINLRTIQRIENNENEPRGKTLHLICEALEMKSEDLFQNQKYEDKTYLTIFHLAVLTFVVIPLGNIIIPLVMWVNKKDSIKGFKKIGANTLNYQITWSIITFVLWTTLVIFKLMHFSNYKVVFVVITALCATNIILPIFYAIQSRKGNISKSYPTIIKLIK